MMMENEAKINYEYHLTLQTASTKALRWCTYGGMSTVA